MVGRWFKISNSVSTSLPGCRKQVVTVVTGGVGAHVITDHIERVPDVAKVMMRLTPG